MKTVIKATIAAAIIVMSYNASAKDGAFTLRCGVYTISITTYLCWKVTVCR
ncbi:hypothetical protein [Photobacterium angustum]|uniref:hypothetical protein n=1 Tax=Photobacterium angustum TaxID=661 RepID=UPI00138E1509|nr:hypothetical protein [Photobacterium angustum]